MPAHDNNITTNLKNNQVQNFGIGDASLVIHVLQNMYSHKVRTLVQEYICNARDAHRELGNYNNDFDIVVPNALNPVFKVRDYGVGLDPERIKNVFIMYGASTKRNNNNQTGGFGIGAKSAWCYTDSFNITSYVDGIKRTYVAHLGENKCGRLDLVSEETTTERNGTCIAIAVKSQDVTEFKEAIYRAIFFWDKRPALKGELNSMPVPIMYKINDTLSFIDHAMTPEYVGAKRGYYSYDKSTLVVVDGIIYTIESDKVLDSMGEIAKNTYKVPVLFLGNGTVELNPSRESIVDSTTTLNALEKISVDALSAYKKHIKAEFDKVASTSEFFATYSNLAKWFNIDGQNEYDGYTINGNYVESDTIANGTLVGYSFFKGRYGSATKGINRTEYSNNKTFNISNLPHLFYSTNPDTTTVFKGKLVREYLKNNRNIFILEPKAGQSIDKLISDFSIKDILSIPYVEPPKLPRVKGQTVKRKLLLHTFNSYNQRTTVDTDTVSNTQKYLYVPMKGNAFDGYHSNDLSQLSHWLKDLNIAVCGIANGYMKAINNDANFCSLASWLESYKFRQEQLNHVMLCSRKNESIVATLIKMGMSQVEDKVLVAIVKRYSDFNKQKVEGLPRLLYSLAEKHASVVQFKSEDNAVSELVNKHYPLLTDHFNDDMAKELVYYINAKYSLSQDEHNTKEGK